MSDAPRLSSTGHGVVTDHVCLVAEALGKNERRQVLADPCGLVVMLPRTFSCVVSCTCTPAPDTHGLYRPVVLMLVARNRT